MRAAYPTNLNHLDFVILTMFNEGIAHIMHNVAEVRVSKYIFLLLSDIHFA
jgi:hypothetical protein